MKNKQLETPKSARFWLERIHRAEQVYEPYFNLIQKTREAYKSQNGDSTMSYNIFWSGVETQKPFLYFKRPEAYVERVNKIATPAEQVACKILERALNWNLNAFDFDSAAKYARNDFLISGCGILFEAYTPVFQTIVLPDGQECDVIENETVITNYWDPCFFLADTDHVGVWEDVQWIARKLLLTRQKIADEFGEEAAEKLIFQPSDMQNKNICVYEIWDKQSKAVYWVSPLYPDGFLKTASDPYHLSGFFPCPKPLYATLTNDSLIPVPDYGMISRMIDELNGIVERMRLTMQAIKVSGVYDGAFHRLGDIFEKDVTLVSLADFDRLKANGGIRGVIDFIPIEQYITALEQLARRRDDVVNRIFEITGVSDIMRGNALVTETATAVERKTNFGTLRNQDRQNDMQRFIAELYRIKAEIICEKYTPKMLASFVNPAENTSLETIRQAISLLKQNKLKGMLLHVESNGVVNADNEALKTLKGVETITHLIKEALPSVSAQPLLLPLYQRMIMAVVAQMPHTRLFESVIDQTFNAIQADLYQSPTEKALTSNQLQSEKMKREAVEAQIREMQRFNQKITCLKLAQTYEIEKDKIKLEEEKNRLKALELNMRLKSEGNNSSLPKSQEAQEIEK